MKKILWFIPVLGLAAQFALAADDGGTKTAGSSASGPSAGAPTKYIPPVMRSDDPGDTVIVLLPGPAPDPSAPPAVSAAKPVAPPPPASEAASAAPAPSTDIPTPAAAAASAEALDGPRPYFRRSPKGY